MFSLIQFFVQSSSAPSLRSQVRWFASITLLVWVWMLIYGLCFYKPQFTSDALAMIKDSAITTSYVNQGMYGSSALKTTSSLSANPVLNTMALLKSKSISDALWLFFLKTHPKELDKLRINNKTAWESYFQDGSRYINAKNKTGTDLIQVSFKWSNPAVAEEACQVILETFQEASLNLNRSEQASRSQFLAGQIKEVMSKLQDVRREKSNFKRQTNTLNADFESEELTKVRSRFERELNEVLADLEGKRGELARYQSALGMSPEQALRATAVGMNEALTELKNDYYKLSQTVATQEATLTEKNPKLKQSRAQLAQVERNIAQELRRTLGNSATLDNALSVTDETRGKVIQQMVEAHAGVISLEQQSKALASRLNVINGDIQAFPEVEEGIANIEQSEKALSQSLDAIRTQYMEAKLKEAQTLSNVFIVDAPSTPLKPAFPDPVQLTILSFIIGPVTAVGILMIRQMFGIEAQLQTQWARFKQFRLQRAAHPLHASDWGIPVDEPSAPAHASLPSQNNASRFVSAASPRQMKRATRVNAERIAVRTLPHIPTAGLPHEVVLHAEQSHNTAEAIIAHLFDENQGAAGAQPHEQTLVSAADVIAVSNVQSQQTASRLPEPPPWTQPNNPFSKVIPMVSAYEARLTMGLSNPIAGLRPEAWSGVRQKALVQKSANPLQRIAARVLPGQDKDTTFVSKFRSRQQRSTETPATLKAILSPLPNANGPA